MKTLSGRDPVVRYAPRKHAQRVAIVHKTLPQYRRRFFELLRDRLAEDGIDLRLIYGQPGLKDRAKNDTVDLDWAQRTENRILRIGARELYWQPCLHLLRGADLVIAEQASKLLINYVLQARYLLSGVKFAFWGHGKNFDSSGTNGLGELVKRCLSRRVHWWFAYTARSAAVVQAWGFPSDRTTVVQNAIDTRQLIAARRAVTEVTLDRLRAELGLSGRNVGIYVGAMYGKKRLPFLLEACEAIRSRIPDFEMIFVGAGPDETPVRVAARRWSWIKYVGPKFDHEKVPYFMLAKLFLLPGVVGLAVLDAFALGVPLVTTDLPDHGPEINYLIDGTNGVMVRATGNPVDYAKAVSDLLINEARRQRLVDGCLVAGEAYTVENMVERFAAGVTQALHSRS